MTPPLDAELTIRCRTVEREAWHAYAAAHDLSLSELVRTICNNMSGINDPPILNWLAKDEPAKFGGWLSTEHKRRRRRTGGIVGTTLVLTATAMVALDHFIDVASAHRVHP